MNQPALKNGLRHLLTLAAVFMLTLSTTFAQGTEKIPPSFAQEEITDSFDATMSRLNAAKPGVEAQQELLRELLQPDSSLQAELTEIEGSCSLSERKSGTARQNENCE